MKCISSAFLALVLVTAAPAAGAGANAPYQFALAKLLAAEGAVSAALAAYDEALDAGGLPAGDEAYVRCEYADLLLRLDRVDAARAEVRKAVLLAPDNPDVLRMAAQIELSRGEQDPEALAAGERALVRLRELTPTDSRALVALAQLYLSQGRSREAAEVLEDVARYRPQHPMVTSFLVDALVRGGEMEKAEKVLTEALASDPGDLDVRLSLADVQSRQGARQRAAETLRATPPDVAASTDARRRLAFAQYRAGLNSEALATVDALLAEENYEGGRYLRGVILLELGRPAEAQAELEKLLAESPGSVDIHHALAEALERQGKQKEAAALLAKLEAQLDAGGQRSELTRVRLMRALVLMRAERVDEALEVLAPSLEDTSDPELHVDVVDLYTAALTEQKRYDEALATLEKNLGSEPPAELVARRGELLLRLGRDAEATTVLSALAAAGDESALAAARAYQRADRWTEAAAVLAAAAKAAPDAVPVAFALGASYERSGQREAAIATFRELLKRQPDFAPALNYLGYMWAEQGENLVEARQLIERAVALEPDNGAYIDSLGWVLHRLGEHVAARSQLERAAELVGEDATVFEHLGDVYVALGERQRAREAYEKAVALDGENVEAVRRKLETLR